MVKANEERKKIEETSTTKPRKTVTIKARTKTRSQSLGKPLYQNLTKSKKRSKSIQPSSPQLPPTLAEVQQAKKKATEPELLPELCNKIVYNNVATFRCGAAKGHPGECGKKTTAKHQKNMLEKTQTAQAVAHIIVKECTSSDGILSLKTFGKRFMQKLSAPGVPPVKINKDIQLTNALHEIRDGSISLTQLYKNRQSERKLNPKHAIISNKAILSEIENRSKQCYATLTIWMDSDSHHDKVKEDCIHIFYHNFSF